jgi:DNA-binding protein YbaB
MKNLVEQAEAEAVSEAGMVRIVAGPGGQVKEIDLRNHAFELSGVELGELIVSTMRAAHANLQRDLADAVSRASGIEVAPRAFGGGLSPVTGEER